MLPNQLQYCQMSNIYLLWAKKKKNVREVLEIPLCEKER
jgi:hypothetical protein